MSCGYKYDGLVFSNRTELVEYFKTGKKPVSDITLQQMKTSVLKKMLKLNNPKIAVSGIIKMFPDFSDNEKRIITENFGNPENMGAIYYNYKTKGTLNYDNKNTILPLFNKVTEYLIDLRDTIPLYNQPGTNPISVSEPLMQFLNTLQNENRGLQQDGRGQSGPNSAGLFENEASKWFVPGRQEESTRTKEPTQGTNEVAGQNAGIQNINAEAGIPTQQRSSNGTDPESIKRDTIRNAGEINGHAARVRIATGDYVAWSDTAGDWTSIVANRNGRWGVVRPANVKEIELAREQYSSLYFNEESITRDIVQQATQDVSLPEEPNLNVIPERFDLIQDFIIDMLFNDETNERINTILSNTDLMSFNGEYFFKDKMVSSVNPFTGEVLKTFELNGDIAFYDRRAVLDIKRPLHDSSVDADYFKQRAADLKIDSDLGFMDMISPQYDSFIDMKKNFIKVMDSGPVIYEEEIPYFISSMYFTQKASGGGALAETIDEMLRGQYEIEEEQPVSPDEEIILDQEKVNNLDYLGSVLFDGKDTVETLTSMVNSGLLEIRPSVLYSTFYSEFRARNISYDDVVNIMGTQMFPIIPDDLMSASKIDEYDMLPDTVNDPMLLFKNMGFTNGYLDVLTFLYSMMPEGTPKVKTALKVGLELFFPEVEGIGILNHFPYTKEEMYAIKEKYGEKAEGRLHDIFMNELYTSTEGGTNFYTLRMLDYLGRTLRFSKGNGIKLPVQYERVFSMFRDVNPLYENGTILAAPDGSIYDVDNVDYSDLKNLQYYLKSRNDGGIYLFDSSKIGEFSEKIDFPSEELEMAFKNAQAALSEIGTRFQVKAPVFFHSYFGKRISNANYDPTLNLVSIASDSLSKMNLYEEAAHAAFLKGIRINKDNVMALHRQIISVLSNGTDFERDIAEIINEEVARYNVDDASNSKMPLDELRAHEFLAKLVAVLASYKKEISVPTQKTIIDRIIQWFRDKLGFKKRMSLDNIDDVINFINGLAGKLRTGETINFAEYKTMFSDPNLFERGTLLSKSAGFGVLVPGKRYAVTGVDNKIKMRTVFVVGEVDGVPFVQFEDSETRYMADHISVVPYKGYADKYGLVIRKEAGMYEEKDPIIIDDDVKRLILNDLQKTDSAGNRSFSNAQVYKKYFQMGVLGDMTYPEFEIMVAGMAPVKPNPAPSSPPPPPVSSPVSEPRPIIPNFTGSAEQETLEGILYRINNFDIDQNTISRWMEENVTPEYFSNLSELGEYKSGDTITKKTGEAPKNDQTYIKFQLGVGSNIADNILADLKALFGDDYVKKTLDLLSSRSNSVVGTVLMHAALERDLIGRKKEELSNHRNLTNLQKIVHMRSQAHIRNVSKALNARKTAYHAVNGSISPSDIEKIALPPGYVRAKDEMFNTMDDSVNSSKTKGDINDIADEAVVATSRKQKKEPKKKTNTSKWASKMKDSSYINDKLNQLKDLINKIC